MNSDQVHTKLGRRTLLAAGTVALLAPRSGFAQARTTRIIVPFSAGALTDVIARIYAENLGPLLKQTVVVENKPGAGGVTATHLVATAPPDGNTWLFVSSGHATNPALRLKLPFDTERDFAGLALLASSPSVIVVNASHPARTLADFIALAKQKPGGLSFGSAGVGSATHLAGEYFLSEAGIKMLHVPYKGVQEAVAAVVGNQLDCAFPPIALAMTLIQGGQLRALAVTSPQRVSVLPNTPTAAEQGLAGFDSSIWYGLVLPAGTPKPVMATIAKQVKAVSDQPAVIELMRSQGLVPAQLMLGEFDKFISAEIKKADRLVKASGYKPE